MITRSSASSPSARSISSRRCSRAGAIASSPKRFRPRGSRGSTRRSCARRCCGGPSLAFNLLAISSQTSRGLVEQVEQLKTRSVPQRIAALLLRQAELSGQAGAFVLPFSKTLIARFVGAKLESFSRSLGHLSEQGVQVHNDRVTIEDVGRLARYAGGPASDKPHERKPILTRFASMARRRRFDDALVRYWRKAQGAGAPISLLLIDVGPARRSPGGHGRRRRSRPAGVGWRQHRPRGRSRRQVHGALRRRDLRGGGAEGRP